MRLRVEVAHDSDGRARLASRRREPRRLARRPRRARGARCTTSPGSRVGSASAAAELCRGLPSSASSWSSTARHSPQAVRAPASALAASSSAPSVSRKSLAPSRSATPSCRARARAHEMRKSRFASRPASVSCLTMRATSPGAAPTMGSHAAPQTTSARRAGGVDGARPARAERPAADSARKLPQPLAPLHDSRGRAALLLALAQQPLDEIVEALDARRASVRRLERGDALPARARLRAARVGACRGRRATARCSRAAAPSPRRCRRSSRERVRRVAPPRDGHRRTTTARRPRGRRPSSRRWHPRDSAAAAACDPLRQASRPPRRRRRIRILPEFGSARPGRRARRTWMITPS